VILAEQVSHLPPCCYHPQLSDKGSSGELILLDSMIVYIYTQNLVSKDKFSCYNVIHPPVTIISKNLHFTFIQLMMYIVFIIDYIQHLMNESKMLTFAYICDRRVYYYSCRFHQAHQW
jgi:hypothetical protein